MSRNRKKKDNIEVKGALDSRNFKQNPNWYFKDAVQADVLSRIQMNAFGALSKIGGNVQPTVCALYANPCPGVTWYDDKSQDPLVLLNGNLDSQSKGINRAAQKLWYILTAKSGRSAGYTKADVALLLLGVGAMIETYEFIRRAFGIAYTYNQRNRALPNMLYKAMCINMSDYQHNAADYLKRMNSLMAVMNQLPIPGNVAWFAKCQDIYQNIFMDYPSEMAQLFMISPATTWVIEEDDGFVGGSYLRTVDMCVKHREATSASPIAIGMSSTGTIVTVTNDYSTTDRTGVTVRTLGDYIDVFEEQVNKLLFSSTFSQIYSDILRAFDSGVLSRWAFDYIDEKYNIAPVFDDNRLWMFHNATKTCGVLGVSRSYWQGKWTGTYDYSDVFQYGTPSNDVYQWANTDIVVYNPTLGRFGNRYNNTTAVIVENADLITDFPNDAPTTEERIEYTRYMFPAYGNSYDSPAIDNSNVLASFYAYNLNLPDHWFELMEIYRDESSAPSIVVDGPFNNGNVSANIYGTTPATNQSSAWSKFHHMAILRNMVWTGGASTRVEADYDGELNSWTRLLPTWFRDINDMIYVDLFDIR